MNVVTKPIHEIRAYENNPRNNMYAVDAVASSIEEFGFLVPILIDKDGIIIAGDTRYKAAQKLNLKTVPCIIADELTPKQITAFRIADNKTAEIATWDNDALREELEQLQEIGFDITMTGFSQDEIDRLFQEADSITLVNTSQELNVGDYDDEQFECNCPRCGFKFNRS